MVDVRHGQTTATEAPSSELLGQDRVGGGLGSGKSADWALLAQGEEKAESFFWIGKRVLARLVVRKTMGGGGGFLVKLPKMKGSKKDGVERSKILPSGLWTLKKKIRGFGLIKQWN